MFLKDGTTPLNTREKELNEPGPFGKGMFSQVSAPRPGELLLVPELKPNPTPSTPFVPPVFHCPETELSPLILGSHLPGTLIKTLSRPL